MKIFTVLWISVSLTVLGGCASSKDKVFGSEMSTMKEIHNRKFGSRQTLDKSAVNKKPVANHDLTGAAMESYRKLNAQFPSLHNPILVTYVYPHLTQAGTPIPGYVTYFKLYQSDQVALPGELSEDIASEVRRLTDTDGELNKASQR